MLRRFAWTIIGAALACGIAGAEPVDDPALGFSVDFPCQSATASQIVNTPTGGVTMAMFVCRNEAGSYFVAVSDTPKGAVTDANREAVLDGAIAGIVANLKGAVRQNAPVKPDKTDKISGRDLVIDVPAEKAAAHARVFWSGDRIYQAMAFVAEGRESAKEIVGFLDSFKLK